MTFAVVNEETNAVLRDIFHMPIKVTDDDIVAFTKKPLSVTYAVNPMFQIIAKEHQSADDPSYSVILKTTVALP